MDTEPTTYAAGDRGGTPPAGPPPARRRILALIGVAVVWYVLDLLTKTAVVRTLEPDGRIVDVLGDWVQLKTIRNAGAAFSLGQGMTIVFTVIAIAVIVVIVRLARRLYSLPWAIALGLLLGGALGNLTDRVLRAPGGLQGHVVDFIAVKHYAVFNVADCGIVCGGILIVLLSFRGISVNGSRQGGKDEGAGAGKGAAD